MVVKKLSERLKGKQLCDDRKVVSDIMWKEGFKLVYIDEFKHLDRTVVRFVYLKDQEILIIDFGIDGDRDGTRYKFDGTRYKFMGLVGKDIGNDYDLYLEYNQSEKSLINQVALLLNSGADKEDDKGYREDNELKVC